MTTTTSRNEAAVADLLSALDKCFQPPSIQQVSWISAVRPAVVKLVEGIRAAERRATVERLRAAIEDRAVLADASRLSAPTVLAILDEEAAR